MSNFQKEYFEADSFWGGEMLSDSFTGERITSTIEMIPDGIKSLADIGCGNGIFLNELNKRRGSSIELTGVDRSKTALQYVETRKIEGDITNLPFEDHSIECVTSLEVIEHLPVRDFNKALKELARVSSRYIIISVPFDERLQDNLTTCPSCMSVFNKDLHMRTFSEDYFINLMNEYGFTNRSVKKAGKIVSYVGQKTYRKIIDGDSSKEWDSPICPICGYTDQRETNSSTNRGVAVQRTGHLSKLMMIPKLIWPKKVQYYWIIGLFEANKFK